MVLIDRILVFFRNPQWGFLSFAVGVVGTISYFVLNTESEIKMVVSGFSILILALIIGFNRFLSGLAITCLQKSPKTGFEVEDQHFRRYNVNHGFAKLDVYVDIPNWISEFDIRLDTNGPFEMTAWNLSGAVSFENNHLICREDVNGFSFILKVGGDPDELERGIYNLYFYDHRSNREIHSIELITDPDPPNVDEEELDAEDAEEWGIEVEA